VSIVASATKIGEALAVWLNPDRRERATFIRAIESAQELLNIKDVKIARLSGKIYGASAGRYADFTNKQLDEHEVHYNKRFMAWKDGTG